MKYENWELAPSEGALTQGAGKLPELVRRVMCARGFQTDEEAREFLRTDLGRLNDPFLLKDMDRAVARLQQARRDGEIIAVYGDYDVDGVTSTCLLYDFFRSWGMEPLWYIPRRLKEGYGVSRAGLDWLKSRGAQVVVTVDCGITALEEADYAREIGLTMIVTDHHTCKETLPDAYAVVDPHRADCPYPFKALAGVGVALKLAMAMGAKFEDYSDLVALGTVADVMPLVEENRAMVYQGLKRMELTPARPGIEALLEAAEFHDRVTAVTLGYTLAPRINAAGRLGMTEVAMELLLSESRGEAAPYAQQLCQLNRQRQELEAEIYTLCEAEMEKPENQDSPVVLLSGEGWYQGVVGIVASRLAERYHKCAFIVSLDENGVGKGSCRSDGTVSLVEALGGAQEHLTEFGGHAMAAGFTVMKEKIPALKKALEDYVLTHADTSGGGRLHIDVELEDLRELSERRVEALEMLEPFGAGNPKPVFSLRGGKLVSPSRVGMQGKHMRFTLSQDMEMVSAIFFSCPQEGWHYADGDWVDVAFSPQINEFRGRRSVQMVVKDVRDAQRWAQDGRLLQKYRDGEALTPTEARYLLPSRAEFAALWRYLAAQGNYISAEPEILASAAARAIHSSGAEALCASVARTVVSLDVLQERGLLEWAYVQRRLEIMLAPERTKVNLADSPILRKLEGSV